MSLIQSTAIPSGASAYELEQSLRFDDGRTTCLTRTPASASNRKTFTFSAWVKRGHIGVQQTLMSVNNGSDNSTILHIYLASDNEITISFQAFTLTTTPLLRDTSAWYHIMFVADTTQVAEANRFKIYLNGTQLTLGSSGTFISQNTDLAFNQATEHSIGRRDNDNDRYFDGYLGEVNFVDGQALTPSDFGKTGTYGEWKPIEYSGSYGTNGFYLNFGGGGIMSATGGNSTATDGDYKAASFTSSGTFTPSADGYVEYLVIGGGGAGGGGNSGEQANGGGGAGAYRTGLLPVTGGTGYSITVGAGGAGSQGITGNTGSNSVFSTITAVGGGGGGKQSTNGVAGGSGGGGGYNASGGSGTAGQGNNGGSGSSASGGGGGGASAVGVNASGDTAGNGGAGLASSITGSSVTRAGGGGGATYGTTTADQGTAGSGGSGGGGAGKLGRKDAIRHGDAGAANTGSGGGGAAAGSGITRGHGGYGGSGIVIIRYKFQ